MKNYFISLFSIYLFVNQVVAAEDMAIHGSISQSFIKTAKNDFLFSGTNKGSFEFTEAVINTTKSVNNKLNMGAQLLSRNFGDEGNFKTTLDWAFGDYQVNEKFGMRVGRIRLPLGFYNEYRDVDSAQTAILRQQGPYHEPMRAFILSYSGFGIYGSLFSESKAGVLDYQLYYGTLDIPSDFSLLRFVNERLNTTGGLETEYIRGGQVVWTPPVEGLRFGYSLLDYNGAFNMTSPALIFNPALTNFSVSDGIEFAAQIRNFGIEYQRGPWTLCAEYQSFQLDAKFSSAFQNSFTQSISAAAVKAGSSSAVADATASAALSQTSDAVLKTFSQDQMSWYLSASYQISDNFSNFISYGEKYADKTNKGSSTGYRKDTSFGFRYDFSMNWRAKVEYHSFSGIKDALIPSNKSVASDKWNMFATRVSFDF